jgi:transcriptional regulator with XRE-family HTH domain
VNLLFGVFDRNEFSILLKKAMGDRSINRFAASCCVSATYISKLLRKLVNNPPGVEVIKKISMEAYNISYDDLMRAAGHYMDETEEKQFLSTPEPSNLAPDPREIVAAHREGNQFSDLPPEAVEEIRKHIEYVRYKYKKQPDGTK